MLIEDPSGLDRAQPGRARSRWRPGSEGVECEPAEDVSDQQGEHETQAGSDFERVLLLSPSPDRRERTIPSPGRAASDPDGLNGFPLPIGPLLEVASLGGGRARSRARSMGSVALRAIRPARSSPDAASQACPRGARRGPWPEPLEADGRRVRRMSTSPEPVDRRAGLERAEEQDAVLTTDWARQANRASPSWGAKWRSSMRMISGRSAARRAGSARTPSGARRGQPLAPEAAARRAGWRRRRQGPESGWEQPGARPAHPRRGAPGTPWRARPPQSLRLLGVRAVEDRHVLAVLLQAPDELVGDAALADPDLARSSGPARLPPWLARRPLRVGRDVPAVERGVARDALRRNDACRAPTRGLPACHHAPPLPLWPARPRRRQPWRSAGTVLREQRGDDLLEERGEAWIESSRPARTSLQHAPDDSPRRSRAETDAPVASSYSRSPSAWRSARPSTPRPSRLGTAPGRVRASPRTGPVCESRIASSCRRATPRSIIFTTCVRRDQHVLRLQVAVDDPASWIAARPFGDSRARCGGRAPRARAPSSSRRARRVWPSTYSITRKSADARRRGPRRQS